MNLKKMTVLMLMAPALAKGNFLLTIVLAPIFLRLWGRFLGRARADLHTLLQCEYGGDIEKDAPECRLRLTIALKKITACNETEAQDMLEGIFDEACRVLVASNGDDEAATSEALRQFESLIFRVLKSPSILKTKHV